jgi:tetratricopeptide (TPR) repeat protein
VALGLALLLLAACSRSRSAAPEVPASALQTFRRGVEAYREEDYPRAAHLFELAAAKDERNAIVYYNLGLAYYMLEAYPESIEAYQKCLKLDPKFTDAHMNLALAYDRTYDLDQANAHYNEYLALVRASRPQAEGVPGGGSAKPAAAAGSNADAAPSAKKARPAMGGEPLSSLPGGNLYQPKPDAQAAARARAGQSSPGARVPVNELRRAPVDSGKGQPFRPNDSSSNDAAQWWTQESLPKTR